MMNFCLPVSTFSETFGRWLRSSSALVLGYYYFLVFLAFVAPKKNKIIYRINNNDGKWALALAVCSVVFVSIYTHLILHFSSFEKK